MREPASLGHTDSGGVSRLARALDDVEEPLLHVATLVREADTRSCGSHVAAKGVGAEAPGVEAPQHRQPVSGRLRASQELLTISPVPTRFQPHDRGALWRWSRLSCDQLGNPNLLRNLMRSARLGGGRWRPTGRTPLRRGPDGLGKHRAASGAQLICERLQRPEGARARSMEPLTSLEPPWVHVAWNIRFVGRSTPSRSRSTSARTRPISSRAISIALPGWPIRRGLSRARW